MNKMSDVKQRLIDHLAQMDLNKMSMMDLREYTGIVYKVISMEKPDYLETMAKAAGMSLSKPPMPVILNEEVS